MRRETLPKAMVAEVTEEILDEIAEVRRELLVRTKERDEARAEAERLRGLVKPAPRVRGVDFPCEDCGAMIGSFVERGFNRCNGCGYPSQ